MAKFQPYGQACSLRYPAYHHQGARGQAQLRYVVLHSTEGPSAAGAAAYFVSPASGGSATKVVDENECFRCLNDFVTPSAAPPLNTNGIHLEQAGYATWTRKQWLSHERTLRRAAYHAARACRQFKIPPRALDLAQLRLDFGVPGEHAGPREGGITTHAVVSAAFGQSDHTDPGAGYPLDVLLTYVHEWLGDVNL